MAGLIQDKDSRLQQFIDGIIEIINELLLEPAQELARQRNLDTAEGVHLDAIGARYGLPRPGLLREDLRFFGFDDNGESFDRAGFAPPIDDQLVPVADTLYRQFIRAKGAALRTDGTVPSMENVLNQAFGTQSGYTDFQDMSISVSIRGDFTPVEVGLLQDLGLIPKPAGVRLRSVTIEPIGGNFGFDDNGVGFDQGNFAAEPT